MTHPGFKCCYQPDFMDHDVALLLLDAPSTKQPVQLAPYAGGWVLQGAGGVGTAASAAGSLRWWGGGKGAAGAQRVWALQGALLLGESSLPSLRVALSACSRKHALRCCRCHSWHTHRRAAPPPAACLAAKAELPPTATIS